MTGNLKDYLPYKPHNTHSLNIFFTETPRAGITCPSASLFFSAVSVQTAAVSPFHAVLGSQSCVQFSTAPAVVSKPVAILCLSRYSASVCVLHAAPV